MYLEPRLAPGRYLTVLPLLPRQVPMYQLHTRYTRAGAVSLRIHPRRPIPQRSAEPSGELLRLRHPQARVLLHRLVKTHAAGIEGIPREQRPAPKTRLLSRYLPKIHLVHAHHVAVLTGGEHPEKARLPVAEVQPATPNPVRRHHKMRGQDVQIRTPLLEHHPLRTLKQLGKYLLPKRHTRRIVLPTQLLELLRTNLRVLPRRTVKLRPVRPQLP